MKNFILIGLLALFSLTVHAQAKPMLSTTTGKALDTVTNTATKTQRIALDGYQDMVSIVATVTKLTGTAAGAVTCWGSVDKINWVRVDTVSYTVTDVAGSQSTRWAINPSQFPFYQISYTGVGTMTATLSSKIFARKK